MDWATQKRDEALGELEELHKKNLRELKDQYKSDVAELDAQEEQEKNEIVAMTTDSYPANWMARRGIPDVPEGDYEHRLSLTPPEYQGGQDD